MVVYLDVLFAVNVLMDSVSLFARLRWAVCVSDVFGCCCIGVGRRICGAGGGGAAVGGAAAARGCGWLACAVAFGGKPAFGRVCALYFVVAASFVGLAMALVQ